MVGTQGREVKTKSVKKKSTAGRGRADSESEDEEGDVTNAKRPEMSFMSLDEIISELKKQSSLTDSAEQFVETIASQIQRLGLQRFSSLHRGVAGLSVPKAGVRAERRHMHEKIFTRYQFSRNFW